jgi:hypothetical protein
MRGLGRRRISDGPRGGGPSWSKEWDGGGASREHAAARPDADGEAFLY